MVEKAGTKLEQLLCVKDPWTKERCFSMYEGGDLSPCSVCQEKLDSGFFRRNVVYNHLCYCYWGMKRKSLREMTDEHDRELSTHKDTSHALKHLHTAHAEIVLQGDLKKPFS